MGHHHHHHTMGSSHHHHHHDYDIPTTENLYFQGAHMSLRSDLINALYDENQKYDVCGIISAEGKIYPLGSDTKVLSTIFELFSRPIINKIAEKHGYIVEEPKQQNHYPDFTLYKPSEPNKKIAIDIKTTYTNKENEKIKFTLGGYTSFIRNNTKNIVYPFDQYIAHWIIGYVYTRVATRKSSLKTYNINELNEIPKPYKGVKVFLQDKWVIAGDLAGSGNTTNIGSIHAHYKDFVEGKGLETRSGYCLDLKTQVQTPQGMKEISNIQVGDLVLSNTGYNEVLNVFPKSKKKSYKITLEDGKEIICSEEHLFPTQTGEMNISGGLKEGMCLYVKE